MHTHAIWYDVCCGRKIQYWVLGAASYLCCLQFQLFQVTIIIIDISFYYSDHVYYEYDIYNK